MLSGLDEVEWAGLSHAYGAAEDTAGLLRAMASADEDEASEALEEFVGSVFHQGTVYPATVPAVPFLAELAVTAPHQRASLVATVGMLADPHHAYGDEQAEVREAVRAQAERFPPLLADPDPEVRMCAAYTVAQCGDRLPVALLRDRWATEEDPGVRACLALALGLRDAAGHAGLLAGALRGEEPVVRVAAAVALLRAGLPWPAGAVEALAEALGRDAELDYVWQHHNEAVAELALDTDDEVVADLFRRMLDAGPDARRAACYGIGVRCRARRSAPALLLPLVGRLLDDPDEDVRGDATGVLRLAGTGAGAYADGLARIAAGYPEVADSVGFTPPQRATETLAMLADPRWIEVICAAWTAGHDVRIPYGELPFGTAVLAAARERLADGGPPPLVAGLATLIGGWGSAAAAAAPELTAALPAAPAQVSAALAAIGVLPPAALPELRAAASAGDLTAGVALWRLAGAADPLVAAVEALLGKGRVGNDRQLVRVAETAAEALAPLAPTLRPYLTGVALPTYPERHVQVVAARIVHAATGETAAVLPTLRAVLAGGALPASAAAELAARLAEPSLEPVLRELLADQWARVAAVRALWRLGVPPDELAPVLIRALDDEYGARGALPLLVEMDARSAVPALRDLAERDRRLVTSGIEHNTAWQDDQLRQELHRAVAVLTG
ncbi:HEAT repeat domain-containing protein [Micromonospora sp. CPCC 205556]|uniref:HEAT repeat domain-containing protein n=1 Tax=Micromonospora sp. CPCC 205556 TaxID=3122398 RepID=UPI002FEEE7C2